MLWNRVTYLDIQTVKYWSNDKISPDLNGKEIKYGKLNKKCSIFDCPMHD